MKYCTILLLGMAGAMLVSAEEYSKPVGDDFPQQLLWGDTHVHTYLSPDAFSFGNRSITPEDAFRFARGEIVESQTGLKAKLARPLDFLLVSDHSEFLGIFPLVYSGDAAMLATPLGKRWAEYIAADQHGKVLMEFGILSMGRASIDDALKAIQGDHQVDLDPEILRDPSQSEVPEAIRQSVWHRVGEVADHFNEPGRFTAFIGYEWTSMPAGNNLHRNVLFRDGAEKTSQVLPFSSADGGDPEQLWRFLADYEEQTGGKVMAIPHNSNASNGLMFAETRLSGLPFDADYARQRSRWEPILEVTQIKGDSETHAFLSPNDEFADYETWDKANLSFTELKRNDMLRYEYARSALGLGLQHEGALGENPFKFGMIGSTDSHTGLATADEDNYFGKMASAEPVGDRSHRSFFPEGTQNTVVQQQWESAASGYAAVWAEENTREAVFAGMQRREVFATTGPRMVVRVFGGWQFAKGDEQRHDRVRYGYRNGVPMGADLPLRPNDKATPSFLIAVQKDPIGANLDRVQVVKVWLDSQGESHEKVFNVAASDQRGIRNNRVRPVGNTVDPKTASYRNSIGAAELSLVWQDPEFDPQQAAVYYVRVLEIPTPRWTNVDQVHFGQAAPQLAPEWTQERAYTSPIWYQP